MSQTTQTSELQGSLTFLGTGTSMGVPTLGCDCAVCTSPDPQDRRLRPSVLVRWNDPSDSGRERIVVIDTGPDFREQALRNNIKRVDAVFYTHSHADHILGLDDLRPLSFTAFRESGPIPLYATPETSAVLQTIFAYTLSSAATYINRARVQLLPVADRNPVHGVEFLRVPVKHGVMEIVGYRFGRTAYLTDVSDIPEESFALLQGLDHIVLSALRHKPHPSHATVEQALGWAQRIGARQTWLTHIAHELGHQATNQMLPQGVALAYDGLTLPVTLMTSPTHPGMMAVYRSLEEIPAALGPSVAAIGNFDGVHLGHQQILASVVGEANKLGARSVAVTFDPHPERFLRPDRAPRLLSTMEQRIEFLAATGIDAVVILPFDAGLAGLSAQQFVRAILVDYLGVAGLHEGGNFHFGHHAQAGIQELTKFGAEYGFAVHVHPPVHVHGLEVSSSAIRSLISEGDMRRARWMLGRPFTVRGVQARGRGIGTRLLVPTINLAPYAELLPAFGVYITRHTIAGRTFQSVTNVGNRPTFGEASFAVESHLLDFEPIDMDEHTPVEVEFLLRLRGEIQWPSPEALKAQIFKDVAKAKRYFRLIS